MKLFVVKILVEDIDQNSCSVHLFKTLEKAQQFANDEIYCYSDEYQGEVIDCAGTHYTMQSGDTYVTIDIEEHQI